MTDSPTLRVACLQLTPGENLPANLAAALTMAREAAGRGAQLVLLPEYVTLLHASGRFMREHSPAEADHPALPAFTQMAREAKVAIVLGSLTVALDADHIANRSYYIDAHGDIVARYDKLHLFDATLPSGRVIRESSTYRAGSDAVAVNTPWGMLGMSICYDVRFPQLYRALAQAGCRFLVVPSAFTQATGERHWHALLRARAIENACFVLAPATCGTHPGNHATFGHALVVSPDGTILADGGDRSGIVLVDIDPARADAARQAIPSLTHDRPVTITIANTPLAT